MQEIEPPEVPIDLPVEAPLEPRKEGFFKKLFSKKSSENLGNTGSSMDIPLPEISLPDSGSDYSAIDTAIGNIPSNNNMMSDLPDLPPLNDQIATENPTDSKRVGKSKGKAQKEKLSKMKSYDESKNFSWTSPVSSQEPLIVDNTKNIQFVGKSSGKKKKGEKYSAASLDESKSFNWTRPITDQEILIHDSNRYNQDVDKLIAGADKMIDEKKSLSEPGTLLSEHQDIVSGLEPLDIQSLQPYNAMENIAQSQGQADMPLVDVKEHKDFQKISMSHQGIRKKIERLAKLGKINKIQIMSLLKDYDESIEKNIENKELYISRRKQELNNKSQELQSKDGAMRKMEKYLKGLDRKLKEREGNINSIVSGSVEKQLSKRLSQEKKLFKKEISETSTLNRELKRKTVFIERERKSIISKQDRVLDDERKKLAEMQTIYDKKLLDLDTERKSFEQKRTSALELLKRAEPISKELEEIRKIRNYVENSKQLIKRELTEDKELKNIMDKAEHTLKAEQDNLDNLVFTKYIEKKLRSIKPGFSDNKEDASALETNPLYGQVLQCRSLIREGKITDAKQEYNKVKRAYEYSRLKKVEKEALYNAIRELYNDIQLASVEVEMK